jgi:hypothetical protein
MRSDLRVVARTLTLDLAMGEVIRKLAAAGIDCMLLKGPAMTHRLYADVPGRRNYGDIDLLVAPGHFGDAGQILASLGFEDRLAGIRASEAARLQGRPWHRDGAAPVVVDLHRGFHHVADRSAWWELLSRHREVLVVEGQPVMIPDRAGCALIACLHASKATAPGKPFEDLRRAIQLFDDEVWRQAASLARSVGAGGAFAASLCRESTGAGLAARLGLTLADPVAWFSATSFRRGTGSLSLVLAPGSWAVRAQRLRDVAFPSRAIFAGSWPIAASGRGGLAAAHLGRLCVIAARLPRLLLAWRRSARALRRSGSATPAVLFPIRAHHALRVRAAVVAATSWWTLRTWWRVHRRLARGPGGHGPLTAAAAGLTETTAGLTETAGLTGATAGLTAATAGLAGPGGRGAAHSGRAVRLVLACCRASCLETAIVRQARAAEAGAAVDVVIGVTAPASGFRAHAWLDGDRVDPQFVELWRYPAARPGPDVLRRTA